MVKMKINKTTSISIIALLFGIFLIPNTLSLENRYNSTDDLYILANNPEPPPYMAWRAYVKTPAFNTSSSVISNARFYMYVENVEFTPDDTTLYNCSNAWYEDSIYSTLYTLPCTPITSMSVTSIGWHYFNITTQLNDTYNSGIANFSLALNTTALLPAMEEMVESSSPAIEVGEFVEPFSNKYYITSRDASPNNNRTYIMVTYTGGEAEQCSPTLNQNWIITDEQVCDGKDVTTGTGNVIVQANGKLILKGNSNVTTKGFGMSGMGHKVIVVKGSKFIISK